MAVIDVLATMGDDALENHYQVVIPAIDLLGASVANLNMRILSASIPEKKVDVYDIKKRGRTFSRPSGQIDQDKEVSISFRHDKYFDCYKSLCNWTQYIQNNITGAIASDSGEDGSGGSSTFRHNVEIWAISNLTETATPIAIWTLEGAFPTSVGGIDFSEEGSEALTCDVTFTCKNIIYPSAS